MQSHLFSQFRLEASPTETETARGYVAFHPHIGHEASSVRRYFARLRPGVTLTQAKAELMAIHSGVHANDDHGHDRAAEADDAQRELTYIASSTLRPTLLALFWAVASLLFVACLNVTGMLMARFVDRHREFVIRAALGCGRGRLVRQALAESAFLCSGGTLLGLLLAAAAIRGGGSSHNPSGKRPTIRV
jgi:hypothetical protein